MDEPHWECQDWTYDGNYRGGVLRGPQGEELSLGFSDILAVKTLLTSLLFWQAGSAAVIFPVKFPEGWR